jgi:exosortase K
MIANHRHDINKVVTFWLPVAALVIALKQFYSMTSTGQLQWMLWPLTMLLELCSDLSFEQLASGEWLDTSHHISIVKSCAGVNFFIISLLGYVWRWRRSCFSFRLILQALAAAWLTSLLANTLRILISVYGNTWLSLRLGIAEADVHRLIGIMVYFFCLWSQLSSLRLQDFSHGLVSATILYLSVTLLIPWLRACLLGLESIRLEHVAWVVGIPLCAVLPVLIFTSLKS